MSMIHVACAADNKFLPHCAAMLSSVVEHHDAGRICVHFLFDSSIDDGDLAQLGDFVLRSGAKWQAHEVDDSRRNMIEPNRRFGKVAWYRVLLPELVPDLDRVLYLDADTIVCKSLEDLWTMDMKGEPVAAVVNPLYPFMDKAFLSDLGVDESEYFNSGVLLMDLAQWRKFGLTDKVLSAAQLLTAQEWPDQNALNYVFKSMWLPLNPKWNMQNTFFDLPAHLLPSSARSFEPNNPSIVHFIGPYKPWHYRCKHRLRYRYWENLKNTPWQGRAMEGFSFKHRVLRLFPEQLGWRLDAMIRERFQ